MKNESTLLLINVLFLMIKSLLAEYILNNPVSYTANI
jgi:hypothetical protein